MYNPPLCATRTERAMVNPLRAPALLMLPLSTPMPYPQWVLEMFSKPLRKESLCLRSHVPPSKRNQLEGLHALAQAYLSCHPEHLAFTTSEYDEYYLVPKQFTDAIADLDELDISCESQSQVFPSFDPIDSRDNFNHQLMRLGRRHSHLAGHEPEGFAEYSVKSLTLFIGDFNTNFMKRDRLREIGLQFCYNLSQSIYGPSTGLESGPILKEENFTSARIGLVALIGCEDCTIQQAALESFIDIIQADPISELSYGYLPMAVEQLATYISIEKTKDEGLTILRLLIEAYALCIMTLWLQSGKHGSIIPSGMKHAIWDQADNFRSQFIPDTLPTSTGVTQLAKITDPCVHFWISFAIQAAMRLKTEVSETSEMLDRIGHLGAAIVGLTSMMANEASKDIGGPSVEGASLSVKGITDAVGHLKKAFYHISTKKEWFEPMLAFQYLSQVVRYYPKLLDELVQMAFQYKGSQQDRELFFGMIGSIESLLLYTQNRHVTEQCFKILMTLLFFDDLVVKKRIIQAFVCIQTKGQLCISTTSKCLLTLVHETITELRPIIPVESLFQKPGTLLDSLTTTERQLTTHCMDLFIRRVTDMHTESGMSQEPLIAQIARAQTGDREGDGTTRVDDVLRALARIMPNPLETDMDGNSILHCCVKRGNRKLIPSIISLFGKQISIDVLNHRLQTPLMQCVDPTYPTFLEAVPLLAHLGADPNLRDDRGATFWHNAVTVASAEDIDFLLSDKGMELDGKLVHWSSLPNINIRDCSGRTPLMRCLENPAMPKPSPKTLAVAKILIKRGANLMLTNREGVMGLDLIIRTGNLDLLREVSIASLQSTPYSHSALIMAAKADNPAILDYLLSLKLNRPITTPEIIYLFQRAFRHFGSGSAGNEMMRVILAHQKTHPLFEAACQKALPRLKWSEEGGNLHFSCDDTPLSILDIQKSIEDLHSSPETAKLFGINDLMSACFTPDRSPSLVSSIIKGRPQSLKETSVINRTALQMALLHAEPLFVHILLEYERQDIHHADFNGNQAIHMAAATLNVEAYKRLLDRGANPMATNNLQLIPLILALTLPSQMLPESLTRASPYAHLSAHLSSHPSPDHLALSSSMLLPEPQKASFRQLVALTLLNDKIRSRQAAAKAATSSAPLPIVTLESYRSNYGWSILHYAAIYGHPDQARELARCLPTLFTVPHQPCGKIPAEHAFFHQRPETAKALIMGWMDQAREQAIPYPMIQLSQRLQKKELSLPVLLAELGATELLAQFLDEMQSGEAASSTSPARVDRLLSESLQPLSISSPALSAALPTTSLPSPIPPTSTWPSGAPPIEVFSPSLSVPSSISTPGEVTCRISRPIEICLRRGDLASLKLFARDRAESIQLLHAVDQQGNSLIMLACRYRQTSCLNFLLELAQTEGILDGMLRAQNKFGQTALHILCCTRRAHAIDDICEKEHLTPYAAAASLDERLNSCLTLLFNYGADLSQTDDAGHNALHLMGSYNHASMIYSIESLALERFPKFEVPLQLQKWLGVLNDDRRSPIFSCVANTSREAFDALLHLRMTYKLDLGENRRDIFGLTLLHIAAQEGHVGICQKLVSDFSAMLTSDDMGETPIHKAALNRRIQALRYLIGVKPCSRQSSLIATDLFGMNALHKAVLEPLLLRLNARRHVEKLRGTACGLIDDPLTYSATGLSRELKAYTQCRALEIAQISSHGGATSHTSHLRHPDRLDEDETMQIQEVVTLLLDAGLSMDTQESSAGSSVWDLLCRGPYEKVLKHALTYVASRGQTPNFDSMRTHGGYTLAHTCALFGQKEQLKLLLPFLSNKLSDKTTGSMPLRQPSLSLRSAEGFTALAIAAMGNQWDIVDLLITQKCRLDRTTRLEEHKRSSVPKGDTLLHLIASKSEHELTPRALHAFERISALCPKLLMQPNASGELVLEVASAHAHLSLLPLICMRMKKIPQALDSLERASRQVQANLSPQLHSTAHAHGFPRVDWHRHAKVLNYGGLCELMGTAWSGFISKLDTARVAPNLPQLITRAEQYLSQVKASVASDSA